MVPKIIHYCWFGRNLKTRLIEKCIHSWKKYLPGWEIHEWNEDNFDISEVPYVREAYVHKKWAFVSDYVRFKVLYMYGGIYFDTDVELLRVIPEEILSHEAFTGVESNKLVNPGLVFACPSGYALVNEILNAYENTEFNNEKLKTVNEFTTEILQLYGYKTDGKYQEIGTLAIYDKDTFCGYDQDVEEVMITSRTVSVHHYASSWNKRGIKFLIQKFMKRIIGINKYRDLLMLKRKLCKIVRKDL